MSSHSIESVSDPSTLGECRVRKVFRVVIPVKLAIGSDECVPRAFAPALKQLMNQIQELSRRITGPHFGIVGMFVSV